MGTGWRRAFCTTLKKDSATGTVSSPCSSPSPRSCAKLGFFYGGSNPTTPRLHSSASHVSHDSNNQSVISSSPTLRCRRTTEERTTPASTINVLPHSKSTNSTPKIAKSSRSTKLGSNPSSPRSPLKLSLFKNSFKFRSSCGICLNSVKTGQGTAIYTAECGHAFHFPCIASHVRKQGKLVCPVCDSVWKDVPLLSVDKNLHHQQNDTNATNTVHNNNKPKVEEKRVVIVEPSSPKPVTKTINTTPKLRSYDDDEALISPTTGRKFVPIPEVDENAEEEDDNDDSNYSNAFEAEGEDDSEEFQGFFVNPSVKSDDVRGFEYPRNVQVRVLPETVLISSGPGYETYAVALRVKAPRPLSKNGNGPNMASHRAPIDLVTVLDVSGSMSGSKLEMLKRAMRLVVSSLGSSDRLSIVAFSSSSKRLLPLIRMTSHGQHEARRIVDRLVCGQGSSVGEGLRKATRVLEDRRERNPFASILLLSDGHDERVQNNNNSNQRMNCSHASSTRFGHIEIPVHSYKFGQIKGYSTSGENAFTKCVRGLLSVVVQDLRIQLGFAPGSAPADILAVYSCNNGRPASLGSGSVRVGDLYPEEERELLVEVRVPASVGSRHVMSFRSLHKDPATQEVVYGRDQSMLVARPCADRSSEPRMERLRCLFISTRARAEARRLVERGDFSSASDLLVSSRDLLVKSGGVSGGEYVRELVGELAELQWWSQQYDKQRQMMMMIPQQQLQLQLQLQRRTEQQQQQQMMVCTDENGEPLTPTSAWRAAERLAKVAMMKKSLNRVSDLHGFENARF